MQESTRNKCGKYSALDVAKFILKYCTEQKKPISNLKLQKLLYLLWIDYYRETELYLFDDEIRASKFGAVVSNVYYKYACFSGMPIVYKAHYYENNDISLTFEDQNTMKGFLKNYLDKSAYDLAQILYHDNGAWAKVFDDGRGMRKEIGFDLIVRLDATHKPH